MSTDERREFRQPGFEAGEAADRAEFEIQCISVGENLALIMPVEGWAAFLDVMHGVQGQSAALDTMYEGIKYGFGFTTAAEALQPEQPELES